MNSLLVRNLNNWMDFKMEIFINIFMIDMYGFQANIGSLFNRKTFKSEMRFEIQFCRLWLLIPSLVFSK